MQQRARRVAVGSDMQHETASAVARHLAESGWEVVSCGAVDGPDQPWPEVAEQVARLVAQRVVDTAVLCCWTGTGVSIAANKVPGVRAALCTDAETATGARRWNDANVLAMGLSTTRPDAAIAIVEAWLAVGDNVDPEEVRNIERVSEMEARYRSGPPAS
jgi:RpiB/LacA/LacB family sugar-phosphate isomerase